MSRVDPPPLAEPVVADAFIGNRLFVAMAARALEFPRRDGTLLRWGRVGARRGYLVAA